MLISVAWCWSMVEHLMKGSFVWCMSAKKPSLCYVNNMVEHTAREGASLGELERAELQLTKRFFFPLFALEKAVACFLLFAYYLGGRLVQWYLFKLEEMHSAIFLVIKTL